MYISKTYLVHEGKVIEPDEEINLTEEQAERLGDLVEKKSQSRRYKKGES